MPRPRNPARKSIEIPTALHAQVARAATAQDMTISTAVILALRDWLARQPQARATSTHQQGAPP